MNGTNTKPPPQVVQQLDFAEKRTAVCRELVESLHARLVVVLCAESEALPSDGRVTLPLPKLAPVAERLRALGDEVQAASELLKNILDRLEI